MGIDSSFSVLTQAYSFLGPERTLDVLRKVLLAIENSDAAKRVHKPAAWLKSQLVVEVNMIVSDLIGMDVVPKVSRRALPWLFLT